MGFARPRLLGTSVGRASVAAHTHARARTLRLVSSDEKTAHVQCLRIQKAALSLHCWDGVVRPEEGQQEPDHLSVTGQAGVVERHVGHAVIHEEGPGAAVLDPAGHCCRVAGFAQARCDVGAELVAHDGESPLPAIGSTLARDCPTDSNVLICSAGRLVVPG